MITNIYHIDDIILGPPIYLRDVTGEMRSFMRHLPYHVDSAQPN